MIFAIVQNSKIVKHGTAQKLWPGVSFSPNGPNRDFLEEKKAIQVNTEIEYDPETQELEFVEPYLVDGTAYCYRAIEKQGPAPDVRGFYKALIGSQFYNQKLAPLLFSPEPSWVGEPFSVVTAAATNLFLGITEAPSPSEPEPSLQASLWGFFATAQPFISPEDTQEVIDLMAAYGLAGVYTLQPPQK